MIEYSRLPLFIATSRFTSYSMTQNALLPDAAARRVILENLDENLVVEAAAGTGKTTSLVGRIMNLFRSGRVNKASRFAAVTFTLKAAGELRQRLERELDAAIADPATPARELRHLELAKSLLPECHIGTIHSFCARLLRERPVEAGVVPDFREMEPDEDLLYRKRAWDEFSRRLVGGRRPELYRAFEIFGLDLDTLGQGFARFADFPDIPDWPGLDAGLDAIDTDGFVRAVAAFTESLDRLQPRLDTAEGGTDTLIPILQNLSRRARRSAPNDIGQAFQLCRMLKTKPRLVQRQWRDHLGLDKEQALEAMDEYARFCESSAAPFRTACLAAVYAKSLQAFAEAGDIYDRLRRADGVLNFQDLLMLTAGVLREYPEVRADLAARYARLLVDEVQDTDPVQAEIMFLLASEDPHERDWKRCVPRPGALFIVGDPKQSIYRFRRADIVVYQELKRCIVETGGRQLGLTANFRSQPEILDWVNKTLFRDDPDASAEAVASSGRFGPTDSPYSPAYAPLRAGLPPAGDAWSGVFYLETLPVSKKDGIGPREAVADEAARIAAFIRHAVDTGLLLPGRSGPRPAAAGDFLVVTYRKSKARHYAEALRRLGLECRVSSGGTLADSPALDLLEPYLDALSNPDDGIRLLAVLRGGLFGVADTELYRWKKAGRRFSFLTDAETESSPVADALAMMRGHYRLFAREEPCRALADVVRDLGLWEYASLGDHPADSVGVLSTALELLNAARSELPTLGTLRTRLEWLRGNYDRDPLPARESAGQAVRIMNLHKTKGLEAPVVFLTSTRTVRRRDVAFAVRRGGEETQGALAMFGGEFGNLLLAQPAAWDEIAAEEGLFLAAEGTRLNYVAATRAGAALVVSVHKTSGGWKSAFLPEFAPGVTIAEKLPEPDAVPGFSDGDKTAVDVDNLRRAMDVAAEKLPLLLKPSYMAERAKPESAFPDTATGVAADDGDPDWAVDMGEILHRLIEGGDDVSEAGLSAMAGDLLQEFGRPRSLAGELSELIAALRRSDLWRRAARSERVFRETPFTVGIDTPAGPSLRRGVIDLVFREDGGWVVVDYKSDRIPEGIGPEEAAARHAAQLAAYADAWTKLTGEPVVETAVYFLRHDAYARVPIDRTA